MDDLRESHILGNLHMMVYNILQLTNYDYNPFLLRPNTSKKQQRTMGEFLG